MVERKNEIKMKPLSKITNNLFGKFGEGYLRFCYASSTVEIIKEALDRMKEFHKKHLINKEVLEND